MSIVRKRVLVSGLVQGVNFRWYATQHARSRGVSGWVHNLDDGRVEAVFEGTERDVEGCVRWCREGPRHARVTNVEVIDEEPEGLAEFDVEY